MATLQTGDAVTVRSVVVRQAPLGFQDLGSPDHAGVVQVPQEVGVQVVAKGREGEVIRGRFRLHAVIGEWPDGEGAVPDRLLRGQKGSAVGEVFQDDHFHGAGVEVGPRGQVLNFCAYCHFVFLPHILRS